MSQEFHWNPLPFNFIGKAERLSGYLHHHRDLAYRKEYLRIMIKGWFLMKHASEKNRLTPAEWQELMELCASSEYLAPDIRALLMHGHDSQLKRFYWICVDSFAQNCGKALRLTQSKAKLEAKNFEAELQSATNRYVGYEIPREYPGMLTSSYKHSPV
jgi:hypothetical protein